MHIKGENGNNINNTWTSAIINSIWVQIVNVRMFEKNDDQIGLQYLKVPLRKFVWSGKTSS